MRIIGRIVPGVLAGAVLAPCTVWAGTPTFYDDAVMFKAALLETVTDDYSNPGYSDTAMTDAVMSAVLGETHYTTTGYTDNNIVHMATYCAGCNGSFRLSFGTTSVSTGDGVFGVGLDVDLNDTNTPYIAFITYGDGTTENVIMPDPGMFWGVIAPERITQIDFGLLGGGTTQSGGFRIDNLIIGNEAPTANESCDGESLDLSTLTPGSGATVMQDGSTANAVDDIDESAEVACWMGDDAPEHVYQFTLERAALLEIDLEGSSYDTKLAVVAGCPDGDDFCQFNDDAIGLQSALDCMQFEPGAYSIIVSGAGSVGDYELHVTDCGAPCGDGMVGGAEACDDGGESATCDADCTEVACGDDTLNVAAGEECDDGNTDDGDGCSSSCTQESTDGSGGSTGGGSTETGDGSTASSTVTVSSTVGSDTADGSEGSGGSSSEGAGLEGRSGCGCIAEPARGRSGAAWSAMVLLAIGTLARRRRLSCSPRSQ